MFETDGKQENTTLQQPTSGPERDGAPFTGLEMELNESNNNINRDKRLTQDSSGPPCVIRCT